VQNGSQHKPSGTVPRDPGFSQFAGLTLSEFRTRGESINRVRIRAGNAHGDFGAQMIIFQKWIKSFNQEGFDSSSSIQEFGLDMKNSAQVDSFADQIVCTLHSRNRAQQPMLLSKKLLSIDFTTVLCVISRRIQREEWLGILFSHKRKASGELAGPEYGLGGQLHGSATQID
jgi:hypothetical protein